MKPKDYIKDQYMQCWKFLKDNKRLLLIIACAHILFLIIGIVYNLFMYVPDPEASSVYQEFLKSEVFSQTFLGNFILIFTHNIIALLVNIVGGIFLAIIPVVILITDNLDFGYAIVSSVVERGAGDSIMLFAFHNIFESPAIVLGTFLGVYVFWAAYKSRLKFKPLILAYKDVLRVFIFIIIPLLIIAALIEAGVIMNYYF